MAVSVRCNQLCGADALSLLDLCHTAICQDQAAIPGYPQQEQWTPILHLHIDSEIIEQAV